MNEEERNEWDIAVEVVQLSFELAKMRNRFDPNEYIEEVTKMLDKAGRLITNLAETEKE